jgi:hypothetical protein
LVFTSFRYTVSEDRSKAVGSTGARGVAAAAAAACITAASAERFDEESIPNSRKAMKNEGKKVCEGGFEIFCVVCQKLNNDGLYSRLN